MRRGFDHSFAAALALSVGVTMSRPLRPVVAPEKTEREKWNDEVDARKAAKRKAKGSPA